MVLLKTESKISLKVNAALISRIFYALNKKKRVSNFVNFKCTG